MENEVKKQVENTDNINEKLLLSDVSISKIKELFENTIKEYVLSVDWTEHSNYGIFDAINDGLDDAEKKLKDV
jgi:hypothetical protein